MSTTERMQFILDRLEQQDECSYLELSDLLRVSHMTVRRSVEELYQRGAVIKTPGGVRRSDPVSPLYETTFLSRVNACRAEKRVIARCAAELIAGPQTIFVDGSTTCLELAKALATKKGELTVVSNSTLVCLEAGKFGGNRVIGIGGTYDPQSFSMAGPTSQEQAGRLFVDIAFMGTKALMPGEGTFESSEPLFRIKQIIAKQCGKLVLLADHTKFGQRALCKVLDIKQINTVVTDSGVRSSHVKALRSAGIEVNVAKVPTRELSNA